MAPCDSCQPDEPVVYNGIIEAHVCLTCHYAILTLYQTMQQYVLQHLGIVKDTDEITLINETERIHYG